MRRHLFSWSALCAAAVLAGCALGPEDEVAGYKTRAARHDPLNGPAPGEVAAPGATGPSTSGGAGEPSSPTTSSPTPPASSKLAERLSISEVALFQGVKVSLAKAGSKVATRNMPVIAGRDGLLRVYVTPEAGYTPRPVTAELHLVASGQGLPIARDTKTISAVSTDASLASTFNFDVPGSSLPEGVEYRVQLLDSTAPDTPTATSNGAQYPNVGGTEPLDTAFGTDALKIVLVPVRYGADGSNRVPDTSAAMLELLRARTLELYPVPAVNITVHAPIDHAGAATSDGTGWDSILAEVLALRMAEQPAKDVYYYGVFAPAPSVGAYCSGSCVLGLSPLNSNAADASQRASIGVLYNQTDVLGTMPHEIGHAHGRRHAPCGGASGADPNYPYQNAGIGVWGYGIVTKTLHNPAASTQPHDFMSYCGPEWTSDYTFKALFDRTKSLDGAYVRSFTAPLVKRAVRVLFDRASGPAWAPKPIMSSDRFGGEERAVTFYGPGGAILRTDIAHRYSLDHVESGYLLVPDAPAGTTRVVIEGIGDVGRP